MRHPLLVLLWLTFGSAAIAGDLDVRHYYVTNDITGVRPAVQALRWFQGERVKLDLYVRRGTTPVDLSAAGLYCTWEIVGKTNPTTAYIINTGTVANATNGYLTFNLAPSAANLATNTYDGYVKCYQGSTNLGVVYRSPIESWYSLSGTNWAYAGPLTNGYILNWDLLTITGTAPYEGTGVAVTVIAAGTNITVSRSGQTVTVNSSAGGGASEDSTNHFQNLANATNAANLSGTVPLAATAYTSTIATVSITASNAGPNITNAFLLKAGDTATGPLRGVGAVSNADFITLQDSAAYAGEVSTFYLGSNMTMGVSNYYDADIYPHSYSEDTISCFVTASEYFASWVFPTGSITQIRRGWATILSKQQLTGVVPYTLLTTPELWVRYGDDNEQLLFATSQTNSVTIASPNLTNSIYCASNVWIAGDSWVVLKWRRVETTVPNSTSWRCYSGTGTTSRITLPVANPPARLYGNGATITHTPTGSVITVIGGGGASAESTNYFRNWANTTNNGMVATNAGAVAGGDGYYAMSQGVWRVFTASAGDSGISFTTNNTATDGTTQFLAAVSIASNALAGTDGVNYQTLTNAIATLVPAGGGMTAATNNYMTNLIYTWYLDTTNYVAQQTPNMDYTYWYRCSNGFITTNTFQLFP